jgi:hypothetical protein
MIIVQKLRMDQTVFEHKFTKDVGKAKSKLNQANRE